MNSTAILKTVGENGYTVTLVGHDGKCKGELQVVPVDVTVC
jgi:hypothetical protein